MVVAILTVSRSSEYIIVIIRQVPVNLMEICRLLITFANSLDQYQDQQNVGPDLDPNCLCRTHFLKKLILKKVSRRQGKHKKLPSMQRAEHLSGFNQREFSSKIFRLFKSVSKVFVSLTPSSP